MKSPTTSKRVAYAQRQVAAVALDDLLDPERAVAWMGIPKAELLEKARKGLIVKFELGPKTLRFHPRTIIAVLAKNAGVPFEVIAASFGQRDVASK